MIRKGFRQGVSVLVMACATAVSIGSTAALAQAPAVVPAASGTASVGCSAQNPAFPGKIARYAADSTPAWPSLPRPAKNAPNVLIWLADDLGFGVTSAFGGLVPTPNLERLARTGLRYTNFHATPLCSPTRAALLTGRNPHNVHLGTHANTPAGFPGYDGFIPGTAATTARVLNENGYSTAAFGKWDHGPLQYISKTGPFRFMPLNEGFERYYGFLSYESDHFTPTLWQNNGLIEDPPKDPNYFLTTDLADRAIGYIDDLAANDPDRPFYLYWATGAVHGPHQAPREWLERFRGKFDMGWDAYRETVLKRQKAMGLVAPDTRLAPRDMGLPAWSSLTPDQKRLYARQMEALAAQIAQADDQFGRILDELQKLGKLDNTIILFASDNGASGEGGVDGNFSEVRNLNGVRPGFQENLAQIDAWGGPGTTPNYATAWAIAANTPFRYVKQSTYEGGTRVPMILSWPKAMAQAGGVRDQYHHVIDIGPTVLEAAGIAPPDCVDGFVQMPLDGTPMEYSFNDPAAASRRTKQYYELWGNRGIYSDGWKALVLHKSRPWAMDADRTWAEDKWELYHVARDPGETTDLAARHPAKLKQMRDLFEAEASANNVFPLNDKPGASVFAHLKTLHGDKTQWDFGSPKAAAMSQWVMPQFNGRSHQITAQFDNRPGTQGVIAAIGDHEAGFSFYVKDGRLHYDLNDVGLGRYALTSADPLPQGSVTVETRIDLHNGVSGVARLLVNGSEVAQAAVQWHARIYAGTELFNLGIDTGGAATPAYQAPFRFTGTLNKVTMQVTPEPSKAPPQP